MERHKVLAMMSELKLSSMRAAYDDNGLRNPVDLWLPGGGKFHRKTGRKISTPAEVLPCWRAGYRGGGAQPDHPGRPLVRALHRDAPRGSVDVALGAGST